MCIPLKLLCIILILLEPEFQACFKTEKIVITHTYTCTHTHELVI